MKLDTHGLRMNRLRFENGSLKFCKLLYGFYTYRVFYDVNEKVVKFYVSTSSKFFITSNNPDVLFVGIYDYLHSDQFFADEIYRAYQDYCSNPPLPF